MAPVKRSAPSISVSVKRTRTPLKRKSTRTVVTVPRSMGSPIPLRFRNTLTYSDNLFFTTNSAGLYWNGYRCNSCYDPYAGVGGNQPRFFDQLSDLYDHWYVYASRIKIRPITIGQVTAGQPTGLEYGCFINDDFVPTLSVYNDFLESPGYVFKTTTGAPTNGQMVRKTWKPDPIFGEAGRNNALTRGSSTTNPTEQSFFIVTGMSSAGLSACTLIVTIEYDVEWSEIKRVAQS